MDRSSCAVALLAAHCSLLDKIRVDNSVGGTTFHWLTFQIHGLPSLGTNTQQTVDHPLAMGTAHAKLLQLLVRDVHHIVHGAELL